MRALGYVAGLVLLPVSVVIAWLSDAQWAVVLVGIGLVLVIACEPEGA